MNKEERREAAFALGVAALPLAAVGTALLVPRTRRGLFKLIRRTRAASAEFLRRVRRDKKALAMEAGKAAATAALSGKPTRARRKTR